MMSILIFVVISFVQWANADSCDEKYTKFTVDHTACWTSDSSCFKRASGVTNEDIKEILDIHNSIRSKVAMGRETRGGGMPEAANMMQMVWDEELYALAQNQADQCGPVNDCAVCRAVESFPVGQIVEFRYGSDKPSWKDIIQSVYDEIDRFYGIEVDNFQVGDELRFIQLIWGETWRVGCTQVTYDGENDKLVHVYICNYGPQENSWEEPVYKRGPACSACPSNSCCGKNCTWTERTSLQGVEGLCNMIHDDVAPVYRDKKNGSIFYCDFDFKENAKDCEFQVYDGVDKWTTKTTMIGDIKSIKLSGGEQSMLHFVRPIDPKSDTCVQVQFREGLAIAETKNHSRVVLRVDTGGYTDYDLKHNHYHFLTASVHLPAHDYAYLNILYIVNEDCPDHILEIKDVAVFKGNCHEREIPYILEGGPAVVKASDVIKKGDARGVEDDDDDDEKKAVKSMIITFAKYLFTIVFGK